MNGSNGVLYFLWPVVPPFRHHDRRAILDKSISSSSSILCVFFSVVERDYLNEDESPPLVCRYSYPILKAHNHINPPGPRPLTAGDSNEKALCVALRDRQGLVCRTIETSHSRPSPETCMRESYRFSWIWCRVSKRTRQMCSAREAHTPRYLFRGIPRLERRPC